MCVQPTARRGFKSIYLAAAVAAAPLVHAGIAGATPFFMGSDISLLTFMQQQGVVFKDNGIAQAADQILYDNGDNFFRLRLFVNPNTSYSATEGAIQTQAYDIALAQQIKKDDPSAKFELDMHYSDTWADPGDQVTPTEWSADTTLAEMQTQVYNYTLSTLNSFSAAGVMPDMVEIGNETNNGMLYPLGAISYTGSTASQQATWKNYGSLVISAANAVHAAQGAGPKIDISLTIGNGNSSGEPAYFYNNLFSASWADVPTSDVDVMGLDYYPSTNDMSTLTSNINTLAADIPNKSIMLMETDAPWKTDSGLAHDPNYAETPAGQESYLNALASTLATIPSVIGMLYWYPEAVQVPGYNVYNGGATALFDTNGNALQAVIGTAGAGASGNGSFSITQHQWNVPGSGSWSLSGNWTNSSPNANDAEADFLGMISSNQTVSTSGSITLGTMRFQNTNTYTIAGTGSLSLNATVGWAYIVVQEGAQQINVPTTVASSTTFSVSSGCSLTFGAPVTVNSGQILNPSGSGTINYDSSITVAGTASMTIANSTHSTGLTVGAGGTVAIAGAGTAFEVDSLSNNGTINVNSSNSSSSTLIVNGAMTGAGTLNVPTGGLVSFSPNIGSNSLNSLSITGTGTLDLNNNQLLINYGSGADPIASIAAWIASGYANGAWNGTGIISTMARTSSASYGIGYADSADPGNPANLAPGTIEVMYTLLGDANLDGKVNGIDFNLLATNFNQSVTNGWDEGDFNYDGKVNGIDFNLLATNFNQLAGESAVSSADLAAMDAFAAANGISLANVPEPASTGLLILGAVSLLAQRRRVRYG